MKKVLALVLFAGLCMAAFLSSPPAGKAKNDKLRKNANKIENSYIVVLNNDVVGEQGMFSIAPYVADELSNTHKGKLKHIYQNAINGFVEYASIEGGQLIRVQPDEVSAVAEVANQ